MHSNLTDDEYIGRLDEIYASGEIPNEFLIMDPVVVIEEFNDNINSLDDYFALLISSFDDIKMYLKQVEDTKDVDKILEYLDVKENQYTDIQLQLTLCNDELMQFKDKLIDFMIKKEQEIGNVSNVNELECYKNL
jgi:hypothetical protein